jgi:hypothetical protein
MSDELVEIIGRAITGEDRADIIGARAVLAALEAAGMVVVPREPTEEMLSEADSAIPRAEPDATGFRMMGREVALAAWNAAIAASPKKG